MGVRIKPKWNVNDEIAVMKGEKCILVRIKPKWNVNRYPALEQFDQAR